MKRQLNLGLMGGLGVLAIASAMGCEAQVDDDYTGEPLLSLQGNVVVTKDLADADLVPYLAFPGQDAEGSFLALIDGELTGDFPAKFRFDVTQPPSDDALSSMPPEWGFKGKASVGTIVMLPPNIGDRIPFLNDGTFEEECTDGGSQCTRIERQCADDDRCRERTSVCTLEPCELVDQWGDPVLGDITTGQSTYHCDSASCYSIDSTCDDEEGNCRTDLYRCDLPQDAEVEDAFGGVMTTCSVQSETGDTSLLSYEDLNTVAVDYAVIYVTDDSPDTLVSGLMGAADKNRDGQVVLEEAYGHAYDSTLKATSETFAGTQHPTFRYEVKGQGALVLTRLSEASLGRALLVFPRGVSFFVLEKNGQGRVVGEVNAADVARSLSVRPGDYFLRGRGEDYLLEGNVRVRAGQSITVEPSRLTRVAYAELVRKGAHEIEYAHGPQFGVAVRSVLPNGETPCLGAALGYRLDLEAVSFTARLSGCTSTFENDDLSARSNEFAVSLAATHAWDWQAWSAYAGLGLGGTLVSQTFETPGHAPARLSLSPLGLLVGGAGFGISERMYLGLELNLEAHLLRVQQNVLGDEELELGVAARGIVLAGMQF